MDASDFQALRTDLEKGHGQAVLRNELRQCRAIFSYAYKNDLVGKPITMGISFDKRSKKALRKEKATVTDKRTTLLQELHSKGYD